MTMHPADSKISSIKIATKYSSSTTNTLTPLSASVMAHPLIFVQSQRSNGQILRNRRDNDPTVKTSVNRFELCLTLQFETNTALDKFRAKAGCPKSVDLWSTFFLPTDLQTRRLVACEDPRNRDPPPGNR